MYNQPYKYMANFAREILLYEGLSRERLQRERQRAFFDEIGDDHLEPDQYIRADFVANILGIDFADPVYYTDQNIPKITKYTEINNEDVENYYEIAKDFFWSNSHAIVVTRSVGSEVTESYSMGFASVKELMTYLKNTLHFEFEIREIENTDVKVSMVHEGDYGEKLVVMYYNLHALGWRVKKFEQRYVKLFDDGQEINRKESIYVARNNQEITITPLVDEYIGDLVSDSEEGIFDE